MKSIKYEWKDIHPSEINRVIESSECKGIHDWPEPVLYLDGRGKHTVLRILVHIEVCEDGVGVNRAP